jgi:hypothetical protein
MVAATPHLIDFSLCHTVLDHVVFAVSPIIIGLAALTVFQGKHPSLSLSASNELGSDIPSPSCPLSV